MIEAITAVLVVAGAVGAWLLLLPRFGYSRALSRPRRRDDRILMEDALKKIFDTCEEGRGEEAGRLAEEIGVTRAEAEALLERLAARGLVRSGRQGVELTDEGRAYALRIVRVHRLWEQYFASETSLPAEEWHRRAHDAEHATSAEEAEELARRLGQPLWDPHGDPIPSSDGTMAPALTRPLSALAEGETAVIRHIEDEPAPLHAHLTALGLGPGMHVGVVATEDGGVRIRTDAGEHRLSAAESAAVGVSRTAADEEDYATETLADLGDGEEGVVHFLSPQFRGADRRRLLDLGLIPGTSVRVAYRSTLGDPTAYRVRGTTIALRSEQAALIGITRTRDGRVAS